MSFWKRKGTATNYVCLGIKYQDIEPEDLNLFNQIIVQLNKMYNDSHIADINEKLGFDIQKYFHFVDIELMKDDKSTSISIQYKYAGSKGISDEPLEAIFKEKINPDKFYNRVEIEKLSEDIGASVWDRNNFETVTISEFTFTKNNQTFKCINPRKNDS